MCPFPLFPALSYPLRRPPLFPTIDALSFPTLSSFPCPFRLLMLCPFSPMYPFLLFPPLPVPSSFAHCSLSILCYFPYPVLALSSFLLPFLTLVSALSVCLFFSLPFLSFPPFSTRSYFSYPFLLFNLCPALFSLS